MTVLQLYHREFVFILYLLTIIQDKVLVWVDFCLAQMNYFYIFLSSWYAFKKNVWGCARKIDLEVSEKDCEENSGSAATADNL